MKLRKTLYPFAVIIAVPLVIILFILLNQGHFEQMNTVNSSKNNKSSEFYFAWKGFGTPHITSVKTAEQETSELNMYHTDDEALTQLSTSNMNEETTAEPDIFVQLERDTATAATLVIDYRIFGLHRKQHIEVR